MDITKKLYTAIINLKSTAELNVSGYVETEEDFNKIQWLQADKTWSTTNPHSEITWSTLSTEMTRLQTEYDGIGLVQRNRANEYPSIADQFDMQYWDKENNTTTWADAIAKVKLENPK
tara:strand:+ start:678 stop:1031 length:354 start_codon:yes stop_codon:yes gene_type:complete